MVVFGGTNGVPVVQRRRRHQGTRRHVVVQADDRAEHHRRLAPDSDGVRSGRRPRDRLWRLLPQRRVGAPSFRPDAVDTTPPDRRTARDRHQRRLGGLRPARRTRVDLRPGRPLRRAVEPVARPSSRVDEQTTIPHPKPTVGRLVVGDPVRRSVLVHGAEGDWNEVWDLSFDLVDVDPANAGGDTAAPASIPSRRLRHPTRAARDLRWRRVAALQRRVGAQLRPDADVDAPATAGNAALAAVRRGSGLRSWATAHVRLWRPIRPG